jgi:hypothetical protein
MRQEMSGAVYFGSWFRLVSVCPRAHVGGMRRDLVILVLGLAIAGMAIGALGLKQPAEHALQPMRTVDIGLPCTNPPQVGLMPTEYSCEDQ